LEYISDINVVNVTDTYDFVKFLSNRITPLLFYSVLHTQGLFIKTVKNEYVLFGEETKYYELKTLKLFTYIIRENKIIFNNFFTLNKSEITYSAENVLFTVNSTWAFLDDKKICVEPCTIEKCLTEQISFDLTAPTQTSKYGIIRFCYAIDYLEGNRNHVVPNVPGCEVSHFYDSEPGHFIPYTRFLTDQVEGIDHLAILKKPPRVIFPFTEFHAKVEAGYCCPADVVTRWACRCYPTVAWDQTLYEKDPYYCNTVLYPVHALSHFEIIEDGSPNGTPCYKIACAIDVDYYNGFILYFRPGLSRRAKLSFLYKITEYVYYPLFQIWAIYENTSTGQTREIQLFSREKTTSDWESLEINLDNYAVGANECITYIIFKIGSWEVDYQYNPYVYIADVKVSVEGEEELEIPIDQIIRIFDSGRATERIIRGKYPLIFQRELAISEERIAFPWKQLKILEDPIIMENIKSKTPLTTIDNGIFTEYLSLKIIDEEYQKLTIQDLFRAIERYTLLKTSSLLEEIASTEEIHGSVAPIKDKGIFTESSLQIFYYLESSIFYPEKLTDWIAGQYPVKMMKFVPNVEDGNHLVVALDADYPGSVISFNIINGSTIKTFPSPGNRGRGIEVKNGLVFVGGGGFASDVYIYDYNTGQRVKTINYFGEYDAHIIHITGSYYFIAYDYQNTSYKYEYNNHSLTSISSFAGDYWSPFRGKLNSNGDKFAIVYGDSNYRKVTYYNYPSMNSTTTTISYSLSSSYNGKVGGDIHDNSAWTILPDPLNSRIICHNYETGTTNYLSFNEKPLHAKFLYGSLADAFFVLTSDDNGNGKLYYCNLNNGNPTVINSYSLGALNLQSATRVNMEVSYNDKYLAISRDNRIYAYYLNSQIPFNINLFEIANIIESPEIMKYDNIVSESETLLFTENYLLNKILSERITITENFLLFSPITLEESKDFVENIKQSFIWLIQDSLTYLEQVIGSLFISIPLQETISVEENILLTANIIIEEILESYELFVTPLHFVYETRIGEENLLFSIFSTIEETITYEESPINSKCQEKEDSGFFSENIAICFLVIGTEIFPLASWAASSNLNVRMMRFVPDVNDGNHLVVALDADYPGSVISFNIINGSTIKTFPSPGNRGRGIEVKNGLVFVGGGGFASDVYIYDYNTGQRVKTINYFGEYDAHIIHITGSYYFIAYDYQNTSYKYEYNNHSLTSISSFAGDYWSPFRGKLNSNGDKFAIVYGDSNYRKVTYYNYPSMNSTTTTISYSLSSSYNGKVGGDIHDNSAWTILPDPLNSRIICHNYETGTTNYLSFNEKPLHAKFLYGSLADAFFVLTSDDNGNGKLYYCNLNNGNPTVINSYSLGALNLQSATRVNLEISYNNKYAVISSNRQVYSYQIGSFSCKRVISEKLIKGIEKINSSINIILADETATESEEIASLSQIPILELPILEEETDTSALVIMMEELLSEERIELLSSFTLLELHETTETIELFNLSNISEDIVSLEIPILTTYSTETDTGTISDEIKLLNTITKADTGIISDEIKLLNNILEPDSGATLEEIKLLAYLFIIEYKIALEEIQLLAYIPINDESSGLEELNIFDHIFVEDEINELEKLNIFNYIPVEDEISKLEKLNIFNHIPVNEEISRLEELNIFNHVTVEDETSKLEELNIFNHIFAEDEIGKLEELNVSSHVSVDEEINKLEELNISITFL
jgi:hypothetical protein